jgi:predicted transcriptional regulator
MNEPKTFEDFECMIPSKSVSRVLERLRKSEFLIADKENDYIFFFRTKRDSNKAEFSSTEKRVYENITIDGIPARKLAEKTGVSIRRVYKYLRRLKGKKLVFARKRPKRYSLTEKGYRVTEFLNGVCNLTSEIQEIASYPFKDENYRPLKLGAQRRENEKEEKISSLVGTFAKQG